MRAMVLQQPGMALRDTTLPDPVPAANQVSVRVAACGVCRTDLHVVDGELTEPKLAIIQGHEIVGRIEGLGADVTGFRVGAAWTARAIELNHSKAVVPRKAAGG